MQSWPFSLFSLSSRLECAVSKYRQAIAIRVQCHSMGEPILLFCEVFLIFHFLEFFFCFVCTLTCAGCLSTYFCNADICVVPAQYANTQIQSVSTGIYHTCAITTQQHLFCFGSSNPIDQFGQFSHQQVVMCKCQLLLGTRVLSEPMRPPSVSAVRAITPNLDRFRLSVCCFLPIVLLQCNAPPSVRFRSVWAGFYHSCGIRLDKSVVCWCLLFLPGFHRCVSGAANFPLRPTMSQYSANQGKDLSSNSL